MKPKHEVKNDILKSICAWKKMEKILWEKDVKQGKIRSISFNKRNVK